MDAHRLVSLAEAEVIAGQNPLPGRQGTVAEFVFERVVHGRGGEARAVVRSEAQSAE
jgi:hypothetical protein